MKKGNNPSPPKVKEGWIEIEWINRDDPSMKQLFRDEAGFQQKLWILFLLFFILFAFYLFYDCTKWKKNRENAISGDA